MTALYKLPDYKQHPIAIALMPGGMDDKEYGAFKNDCVERGIIMPITLYEGMVLDGWHRYRVARETGQAVKEMKYDGKDPAGYIASVNVHRRKLSSLQRALVGARLHRDHGLTQREACKKLAISNEVITLVLKTMDSGNTPLIKKIETDADFTRGMLKEELEDAGLLRAKPKMQLDPATLRNSVFDVNKPKSFISDAAAASGLPDTDGSDEEELIGDTGKGLKATKTKAKKATKTAAQELQEQYEALMQDEKISFLQMIWPTAKGLLKEAGLDVTPPVPTTKVDRKKVAKKAS